MPHEGLTRRSGEEVDVLASLLDVHRLTTVVAGRIDLASPWRLQGAPNPLLTVIVQAAGTSTLVRESAPSPIVTGPGDVVIHPHGSRGGYIHDGSDPVHATRQLTIPSGSPTPRPLRLAADAVSSSLVFCLMQMQDLPRGPLWSSLPATIHLPTGHGDENGLIRRTTESIIEEAEAPGPASTRLVSRLAETLLILALRVQAHERSSVPGLRSLVDPTIAPAVQLIHAEPGAAWTVAALAARCGLSRSAFAARFTGVVGETPLSYLTGWRVTTAGNLLSTTDMSIGRIAETAGYRSEAAFRKAFVTRVGMTPRDYRRQHGSREARTPQR